MNKQLEKAMLDGKIRLVDCDLKDVMYLYEKYFFNFEHEFFTTKPYGYYSSAQAQSTQMIDMQVLDKGIVTNDGAIYPVYNLDRSKSLWLEENHINNHVISSAWLRLNGIDLSNSVRYARYEKGLEFYPCHECFKKLEGIEDVDTLIKTYVEIYEKSLHEDHVVGLLPDQIRTMSKVAQSLNENFVDAVTKTDCFGYTKKPNQYEDYKDHKNAKYNRLYLKEVFQYDENDLTNIENGDFRFKQ